MVKKEIRDLLEKAQGGDEEAFNEIYRRYYQSAYIKANSLCQNDADAKDAVQDAFLQVYKSLKDLKEIDLFYSWLIMIVLSKCKNQFHKHRIINHAVRGVENNQSCEEDRTYMDPIKYTDNEIEHEILMKLIHSLPPIQSELIELIYLQEYKLAEVAKILDIPLGTVKTRTARAKKELQKKVALYEKEEHRRIHFHVNVLIPTIFFGGGYIKEFFYLCASKVKSATAYASNHATMTLCTASLTVLTVSGGTFLYDDLQKKNSASTLDNTMNYIEPNKAPQNDIPSVPLTTFPSTTYQEETITTSKEAYYACLNFAKSEEELKDKTPEEIEETKQLYELLKKENGIYYQNLIKEEWNVMFENFSNKQK